jgi:hypothetical protein
MVAFGQEADARGKVRRSLSCAGVLPLARVCRRPCLTGLQLLIDAWHRL